VRAWWFLLLWAAPAAAQGPPIPRDRSASRGAPGFELAYGPRAQLSLGGAPELARWSPPQRPWRLDVQALLATENAASRRPLLATELGRVLLDLGLERAWLGNAAPGGLDALALRLGLGVERTWQDAEVTVEEPRPWDLPFGAGGVFTSLAVSWSLRRGPVTLRGRLEERVYLPGWLAWAGARSEADLLGGYLATGIGHAPSAELTGIVHLAAFEPVAALLLSQQVPLDDAARPAFFVRAMAGPSFRRSWWFLSADAGNGVGRLTVRREARLSAGVRLALP
jgi:hypothetical protein